MELELQQRIRSELEYEANREAPPEGFPAFPEVPAGRYTDQGFYDLEMEHVFGKTWLPVARLEELEKPGSFIVWKKLNRPILVVLGKDHVVRAFYNSCRHRGAALTPADRGQCNVLRCQYHSWAYDFTGQLIAVPDENDFCGLNKKDLPLIGVRCEVYGGTIYVNLHDDAAPLSEHLAPMLDEWATMELEKLRVVHRRSTIIGCNWKAAVDAFQEVYHINTVHRDTIGFALNHKASSMGLFKGGHSRMVTAYNPWALTTLGMDGPDTPNIVGATPLHRETSTAYLSFPNMITPFRSIFVQQLRFWPRGINECEMEVVGLGPDWGEGPRPAYWDKANVAFDKVLDEDLENLGSIQASMQSKAFPGLRLSYQERRIYWMHEEVDRRIGSERIAPELRVKPVLGSYAEKEV
jgi:choline monooxygenase